VTFPWEKYPVFAGLNAEALDFLRGKAGELQVQEGEVIVREGELGNRMFLLSEGTVRVCKRFGSTEVTELARLRVGEFFGEMCILETLPRSATVQALEASHLFFLTSVSFYRFYEAMPAQYSILVLNIARDVSRRLRKLDEDFAARH
jgi:CRP/FNR family cyclic AMP-dependent transcriptional regulator